MQTNLALLGEGLEGEVTPRPVKGGDKTGVENINSQGFSKF